MGCVPQYSREVHVERTYALRTLGTIGVGVLVFALVGLMVGAAPNYNYPNGVVKIGVVAALTGSQAGEGRELVDGAALAVEELNAAGGVYGYRVELVVGDIGSDLEPGTITGVYEKLINSDNVDAIMSGFTSATQFEDDLCRQYNMVYIANSEAQSFEALVGANPDAYPTVYNMMTSYRGYQTELPLRIEKWAREGLITLPNKKVALSTSDNAYSRYISDGLRANFLALGWEITVDQMVAFGTNSEWGPFLARVRQDPPALMITTDYIAANGATLMEQFLQNPTNSHVFMQYGPSTAEFVDLLGSSATGVLYNWPALSTFVTKYQQGLDLVAKFEGRWGYTPSPIGVQLYCAVHVWAQGAERAGGPKDHLAVGKSIGEFTAMWTALGLCAFDPATHLAKSNYAPMTFYQLWDGQRLVIDPEEYADAAVRNPPWWR